MVYVRDTIATGARRWRVLPDLRANCGGLFDFSLLYAYLTDYDLRSNLQLFRRVVFAQDTLRTCEIKDKRLVLTGWYYVGVVL